MATEREGDSKVTTKQLQPKSSHEKQVTATSKPIPATAAQQLPSTVSKSKPVQTTATSPTSSKDTKKSSAGSGDQDVKPSIIASSSSSAPTTHIEGGHKEHVHTHHEQSSGAVPQSNSFTDSQPRQVIAVSASKNPAAFFNLARRFLVTDEYCDLSALEGAIVSAVDAAHLLERSKLAHIVRIQTSYVTVEPRKKSAASAIPPTAPQHHPHSHQHQMQLHPPQYQQQQPTHDITHGEKKPHHGKKGNPLRRSRIIITVKRTEDYKQWLVENDAEGDHGTTPPLS